MIRGAASGIPVEAAVVYRYSSENESGAILMTESPVWRESLYYDQPFREWVARNSTTLLKARPEIREHGLWVVRWIYSTARCSLNAWTAKEKQITIGFKAKAVGAGELGPDADWYESSADSGWIHSQAEEGDRKVVFLGGLHFLFKRFSRSGQHLKDTSMAPKWTFRGANDQNIGIIVDLDGDESYEITYTEVGKLEIPAGDISDNDF